MVSRAAKEFESLYRSVREDIFAFCRALRWEPTWQQAEILQRVMEGDLHAQRHGTFRNFAAVKSGQGPGKTTVAVVIALWRGIRWEGAMIVLTAPTQRQCRDGFLAEARRIMARADPILQRVIEVEQTRIRLFGGKDWGVKTVTATKPENAQGYHEPHLTIIMDEASGVPRPIVEQFKGTISNPDVLFLMIGNPNTRDCSFFDCFNSLRDQWWTYTMNAEDTARDYPRIVSPSRNEELALEYGRDSDVYRIRVLGEFPFQDPDCVISSEDLELCTKTDLIDISKIERYSGHGRSYPARQFGEDFARFGGDESVIYQRLGNSIINQWIGSHVDPNDVVDKAIAMHLGSGWSKASTWHVADAGGMGQGVMKNFYRAGLRLKEFHFGGSPSQSQYANLATDAWFHLARLARARRLHIPKDNRLIQQLSSRKYTTDAKGKLIIWSKDQYMKEGHDSPDRADTAVMALYDAMAHGSRHVRQGGGRTLGMDLR